MNPIRLGPTLCGTGQPVLIAFEIGPTITGLDSALALTDIAARAGAQAIKAQLLDADRLVGDPGLTVSYTDADGPATESMLAILRRRELTPAEWRTLGHAVHAAGLLFFVTVDFPETMEWALQAGADSLKVCSGDVTHLDWIEEMAQTGLPIQVDTGNAGIGELEVAVEACARAGNRDVVIHHCPSGYPAHLESINLRVIPTLRQMFPECVVAFSDHSVGRDMDLAAVALGASLIEKTLTLDRRQQGPEHVFSLEPDEAAGFVCAIREMEQALGTPRRILTDAERVARRGARRSAYLARDVAAWQVLVAEDLDWRRPGGGLEPADSRWIVGRAAHGVLPMGHRLVVGDLD